MSLMVGVSGIRGVIGETLTPELAARAGGAMATYAHGGRVVIGRDSRPTGDMVKSAVVSGLLAGGCEVIDLGVVSTPGTAMMVQKLGAAGGIVITASHNPSPWNGIKFLTAAGTAPPATTAREIIGIFESRSFRLATHDAVGCIRTDNSTHDYHVRTVLGLVDAERIRSRRFRVVLDSVNGAGGPSGRLLLDALGCHTVAVNAEPTGRFAHPPEPIKENLAQLCESTGRERADVGFAQDPDADRLALVDERGTYIGEEYTLALAAKHVLATRPGPACANLSTSRMIDDLAAQATGRCPVFRSAVGEANVVETMKQHNCTIGGEGNGGVIDPRVCYVRDSLTAMAFTLQVMTDAGQPLSRIVATLPAYAMVKQKFACDKSRIAKVLEATRGRFADAKLSTIDGVRIDWPEGWVHVRGSNTEPIMRIIAEARDVTRAEELISRVRAVADAV